MREGKKLQFRDSYAVYLILLIPVALNILTFNKYMPFTDGWWETFGYLNNKGLTPGKDFYLPWTPLFVYVNSFYQKLFGVDFFTFRLIGIFIFYIEIYVFYKLLSQFFSNFNSAIAAVFTNFLWASMPAFMPKDYHTYLYIFEFLSVLFFVKAIKNIDKFKYYIYTIIAVFFLVILFLIKQNIGATFFASLFISYILLSKNGSDYFFKILFISLLFIFFFLIFQTIFYIDFSVISNNDSKGGLLTVLMRFLMDSNIKILILAIILALSAQLVIYYFGNKIEYVYNLIIAHIYDRPKYIQITYILLFLLFDTAIIYVCKPLMYPKHIFIPISIAVIICIMLNLFFKKNRDIVSVRLYKFMSISITALTYCNTQTAYFDYGGTMLCIGFAMAYIISINIGRYIKNLILYSMFFIITIYFIDRLKTPYSWWYNYQGSIFKANKTTTFKELDGIYVDRNTSEIYNYIHKYIKENSKTDMDCYFFNLPIMYVLNEKTPPYKMVTQWFDVSPTNIIQSELNDFIKDPADNIILYQYPIEAFKIHELWFKRDYFPQRDFFLHMNKLVIDKKYRFVKSFLVPREEIYKASEETGIQEVQVIVQNTRFENLDINNLSKWLVENNVNLSKIKREGILLFDANTNTLNPNYLYTIKVGDVLTINGKFKYLYDTIPRIGVQPIDYSWINSITIYKKIDQ